MITRLRFLESAQWWPLERLEIHRNQSFRDLIATACREVPFYRSLLDASGIGYDDIRTPADLRHLPIVTKDMLRQQYPDGVVRNTGMATYEARTSGSTGKNFSVREDSETAGWYRASFLLALEWAGYRIGDAHVQTGMNLERTWDRRLKDLLLRCHYVPAFDLSDDHLKKVLDLIERKRIRHLWGYPGSIYYLARLASTLGWNRDLDSIVTWGDNLHPYRATIEKAFRTRVVDTYGCGEGMQIAAQCGHGDGYHVHMLDVIVEIIDDRGLPAPAGQPGNIVVTRLHPGPMPLIRYDTGDVGIAGDRECGCGRQLPVLEAVLGRQSDVVVTPGGNRLIVHFFTGIFEHIPEIDSFQVVQRSRDSIEVRVLPASDDFSEQTAERVVASLREKGLHDMQIDVAAVSRIDTPATGKRRFIISEIDA